MTPPEKKRLFWILAVIFFFFANLIVVTIFAYHAFFDAKPPINSVPATLPATQP
jgi:hypothetical protein